MSTRPVIGITMDHEPPGGYSRFPWYALRENYAGAVRRAGGLPVALPHEPGLALGYMETIDGLDKLGSVGELTGLVVVNQ